MGGLASVCLADSDGPMMGQPPGGGNAENARPVQRSSRRTDAVMPSSVPRRAGAARAGAAGADATVAGAENWYRRASWLARTYLMSVALTAPLRSKSKRLVIGAALPSAALV